jgi:Uncharacterised protein family (UPF0172)
VDGKRLAGFFKGDEAGFLDLFVREGTRGWARADRHADGRPAALEYSGSGLTDVYTCYLSEGRHRRLSDFDDHLDNIERCEHVASRSQTQNPKP